MKAVRIAPPESPSVVAHTPTEKPVKQKSNLLAATVAYIFLGVLTPLQLYSGSYAGVTSPEFLLCFCIMQFSAIRIAMLSGHKPQFMTLIFYFFVYIWIGWSGGLHCYIDNFPWTDVHQLNDLRAALISVVLAIVLYEIGRVWSHQVLKVREKIKPMQGSSYELSLNRLTALWLFSFLGFAYGVAFFGVGGVLGTRANFLMQINSSFSGIDLIAARSLLRVPCLITFLGSVVLMRTRWQTLGGAHKRLLLIIFLSSGLVTFVANYPPALSRQWLGTVAFTTLFLLTPWTRKSSIIWVLLLTFILTWVYPRADLFRRAQTWDQAISNLRNQEMLREHINSVDYDVLQMIINTHVYVKKEGVVWGNNILGATLFFVPRSIWRGKPERSDFYIARSLNYKANNLSVPLWGESFMAFGWFGVGLIFLFFGYWSKRLDLAYSRLMPMVSSKLMSPAALLLPFLAAYQFIFLRGNLISALAGAVPVIITILFLFRRNRPIASSSLASDPQNA
jgi:hypothetical protein